MVVRCGSDFRWLRGRPFHGEYREIVPKRADPCPPRFYEGAPDGEAVNTVTFVETDGPHRALEYWSRHSCKEHRDAHVDSGMEGGLQEALDHFEQTALSLSQRGALI